MHLLIRWLLNTLALFVVVEVVPGFHYRSIVSLAIAALVLGLLNAIMLELTAWLAPGFRIDNFVAAIIGAIVLGIISWITNRIGQKQERR